MELTLQINDEVSWEKVSTFLAPYIESAAIKEAPKKIWKGTAPWLDSPIMSVDSFMPLTREEANERTHIY
jgi:hypothetical protein